MCLGFAMPDNFRFPYAAVGFSDFWRRWHITLSSWLRDYLYIPLGGNRHGAARTYLALMATMLLGGLWHGASWTFVVWGGLHGLYLAVERALRSTLRRTTAPARWCSSLLGLLTYTLVNVTWVFFRAKTFGKAWIVLRGMAGHERDGAADPATVQPAVGGARSSRHRSSTHWLMRARTLESVVARAPAQRCPSCGRSWRSRSSSRRDPEMPSSTSSSDAPCCRPWPPVTAPARTVRAPDRGRPARGRAAGAGAAGARRSPGARS